MSRGGDSALVAPSETITELPLPDVEVVDVTGAGDAFWSGMLMEFCMVANCWKQRTLVFDLLHARSGRLGH